VLCYTISAHGFYLTWLLSYFHLAVVFNQYSDIFDTITCLLSYVIFQDQIFEQSLYVTFSVANNVVGGWGCRGCSRIL